MLGFRHCRYMHPGEGAEGMNMGKRKLTVSLHLGERDCARCGQEGKRAIVEIGQITVTDGGPDGQNSTSPNTLFGVQGIFIP